MRTLNDVETEAQIVKFMVAFKGVGTIKAGLNAIRDKNGKLTVTRATISKWFKENTYDFRTRLDDAKAEFCDTLEDKAVEMALDLKTGQNPTILLALLNANLPAKYRPNQVVTEDIAKDVLAELRKKRIRAEVREEEDKASESVVKRLQKQIKEG